MIAELGHYALVLALALGLIQAIAPIVGARIYDTALMRLANSTAVMQFAFVALSFAALTVCYVNSDFSVANVFENSHSRMPLIYKMTSVWGNHEGSMLLWVLILALFGAMVAAFGNNLPATLKAYVLAVQSWIASAFYLFILLTSNPFLRLDQIPSEGRDLNPILQDPGLAIHPPLLYVGYVGFSIAFSFAIAALIEGRIDAAWARWVRPWTLAAWMFLTIGIAMGSYWAYYTLGWGGFWFWDPVENASFMPWLAGTALLHSAVVMEKRNALKIWTILLAILTFSLSLIGTFLVRSGVLTSVHAFATDPTRGVFILAILILFIGGGLTLFAWRAPTVETGRNFCADFARRRPSVQQFVPDNGVSHCVCRDALSARSGSTDRRQDFSRCAVFQFNLRAALRVTTVCRAVRALAGVEARRHSRRCAAVDDSVRHRDCCGCRNFCGGKWPVGARAFWRRACILRDGRVADRSRGADRSFPLAARNGAHACGRFAALDLGHGGRAFRRCGVHARYHLRRNVGKRTHHRVKADTDRLDFRIRSLLRWYLAKARPELQFVDRKVYRSPRWRGRRRHGTVETDILFA